MTARKNIVHPQFNGMLRISRQAAIAAGQKFYWREDLCNGGYDAHNWHYTSSGECALCKRRRNGERNSAEREKDPEYQSLKRRKDVELLLEQRALERELSAY